MSLMDGPPILYHGDRKNKLEMKIFMVFLFRWEFKGLKEASAGLVVEDFMTDSLLLYIEATNSGADYLNVRGLKLCVFEEGTQTHSSFVFNFFLKLHSLFLLLLLLIPQHHISSI